MQLNSTLIEIKEFLRNADFKVLLVYLLHVS